MRLATGLRVGIVVLVAAGTALAAWWLPDTAPRGWALAIGIATPFSIAPILIGIQVIVGSLVDPRRPRTSIAHVLRVWWGESLASIRVFLWRVPFRTGVDAPLARDRDRPALLLIHGYFCNRAVWQPLLDSGTLTGCSVATVNLEPVFTDLDRYADIVHAGVQRLLAASGAEKATLVCHSMGGLAARVYLRRHGDAQIARVITLATPHHGTVFGRLGLGANARQMAFGSHFLADLAAGESDALRAKFVCVATRDDNRIVPRTSPLLPGAAHRLIEGVGHLALLDDPRAWQLVAAEVGSGSRAS